PAAPKRGSRVFRQKARPGQSNLWASGVQFPCWTVTFWDSRVLCYSRPRKDHADPRRLFLFRQSGRDFRNIYELCISSASNWPRFFVPESQPAAKQKSNPVLKRGDLDRQSPPSRSEEHV